MAGDWIKMRVDLQTSPKVVRISSATKADRLRVVGALHAVWSIFDAHAVDGALEGYTLGVLDSLIGFAGFSEQMAAVEWIIVSDDSLEMPRYDSHNGKSAKKRAMDSERKRTSRTPENVLEMSGKEADKNATREEKRREEKSIIKTSPPAPVAKAPPKNKGSRLPSDFILPKVWWEWAITQGLSGNEANAQGEIFKDHWVSQTGQKGVKADWPATWRNWIRRSKDFRKPPSQGNKTHEQDFEQLHTNNNWADGL